MLIYLLSHAEFLALFVNIAMTIAFLVQKDWWRACYWLGTVLVVGGVIAMRNR